MSTTKTPDGLEVLDGIEARAHGGLYVSASEHNRIVTALREDKARLDWLQEAPYHNLHETERRLPLASDLPPRCVRNAIDAARTA